MMPNKRKRDLIEQDKNSSPIACARGGEIVLYNAPDGMAKLDVQLEHDTVWLNLDQMSPSLNETNQSYHAICERCSPMANLREVQLLQKMQQLPRIPR